MSGYGLGYIDTRCYNCFHKNGGTPENPNWTELIYQGEGIYICPACGDVLDVSEHVYKLRIVATVPDEDPSWIDFKFIEPFDPKVYIKPHGELTVLEQMDDDLHEYQEDWWDNSTGIYDCEILYQWTSSGYYEVEWDLDIILLKKTPLFPKKEESK